MLVLIFDPDNKIYLQKRSRKKQFYPGRWDVSASTHTEPGESFSEAAVRVVRDKLGLETDRLHFVRQLPACPETGFEFVSIFALHRNTLTITPNPEAVDEGYYYSREELTCLVRNFRELLTPQLVTLWETGTIDS
ncbi:NUDIX domain-containing protein [Pseudodesulfovibrio tunisiensis]|uniref:NUDIX domain-containing protein n=1 Tax=Pseudodesulfovibrio tunisiensis TaxID=463192 RepID=UPI001FB2B406|nr:NUDIX domain-containing protein [Pseudodesulfovibrio tunisiensis]